MGWRQFPANPLILNNSKKIVGNLPDHCHSVRSHHILGYFPWAPQPGWLRTGAWPQHLAGPITEFANQHQAFDLRSQPNIAGLAIDLGIDMENRTVMLL